MSADLIAPLRALVEQAKAAVETIDGEFGMGQSYGALLTEGDADAQKVQAAERAIDALAAMFEPPSDDERAGIERLAEGVVIAFVQAQARAAQDLTQHQSITTIPAVADRIMASPEWRNRHRGPTTDDSSSHASTEYALEVGHDTDTEGIYLAETFEEMATPAELPPYVPGARLVQRQWSVTDWEPVPADELDDDGAEAAR